MTTWRALTSTVDPIYQVKMPVQPLCTEKRGIEPEIMDCRGNVYLAVIRQLASHVRKGPVVRARILNGAPAVYSPLTSSYEGWGRS